MSVSKIRALVVDDEPFARERVRRLLADDMDIEIVAECGDGFQAVEAIDRFAPDLMFLDVQMPGLDGFGVLTSVSADKTPVVIFLTAYDEYAVRAFDAAALDYVLKPFDEDRFAKAVNRAKKQLSVVRRGGGDERPAPMEESPTATAETIDRKTGHLAQIIIRTGGRVLFRKTEEIDWVEAYGNYVRLHFGESAYLLRETIGNLEARLDPAKFARIHRSTLVQLSRIREVQPQLGGQSKITLTSGAKLTLSRRFRQNLKKSLEGKG